MLLIRVMLQNLPDEVVEACLQELDLEHYRRLRQVLFYPENSAGGLMNTDILSLRTEMTSILKTNVIGFGTLLGLATILLKVS